MSGVDFNNEQVALIEFAVGDAAQELDEAEGPFKERDLEEALERSLVRQRPDLARRQVPMALASWAGRLGPADLGLDDGDESALIKVKLGASELWNSAWDMVKLATAVAERKAHAGYLIAAAAQSDWGAHGEGTELFQCRQWDLESLLARYEARFAFWRTDVENYPLKLASRWTVHEHEMASYNDGSEAWDIRIAEIRAPDADLLRVEYAPVIARWRRGGPPRDQVVRPPGLDGAEATPFSRQRLASKEAAAELAGPLARSGAGEGFSVDLASAHFVVGAEGSMVDFLDAEDAEALSERPITLSGFATPMARRAWLEERRLVEGAWPELLRIEASVGMGDGFRVLLDRGTLQYAYRDATFGDSSERIKPDDQAWLHFWRSLDRLGAWDWWPRYEPETIATDGYAWDVLLAKGGRMVAASGYNAFPERGAQDEAGGPEWDEFLACLRDLLGGLRVV